MAMVFTPSSLLPLCPRYTGIPALTFPAGEEARQEEMEHKVQQAERDSCR